MLPTRVEIIPTDGVIDAVAKAVAVPTTISVTCLPHHGIGPTLRTAVELSERGYFAVPHLAAKCIDSRAQLQGVLDDCTSAGITEVFAIGGDAAHPAGPYATGGELLRDIAEITGGKMSVGVAGYPEGHPNISGLQLVEALADKQEYATKVVTQMCFSADAIHNYAALLRREGVDLPVWAGVAGAVPKVKLMSLATKIGVGSSLKFLSKKGPLARRLLMGERYSPQTLIHELAARPGIEGIQLYSFNSLDYPNGRLPRG